ncbi:MAG: glycoside hydrolase family 43 protein [Pirellulales bacterium]|nr:glycoside hydrolase family 43 protein [Pirellulales bacterium]
MIQADQAETGKPGSRWPITDVDRRTGEEYQSFLRTARDRWFMPHARMIAMTAKCLSGNCRITGLVCRTEMLVVCVLAVALPARVADGEAAPKTFTNPILRSGADPWVTRYEGDYLLCQSRRGGVRVARASRLQDLDTVPWIRVWTPPQNKPYSKELWAPELHYLQGKWYIYVAADNGDNANHRMFVLEGTSQDPQKPFQLKGKIAASTDRWAIDGTVLEMPDRSLYFIWSGWEGTENVAQLLYIAPMRKPWAIAGERVCISRPEHDWELNGEPLINEGPEVLWNGDRLFVVYSASGSWGDDYCLGQLRWKGGNVLDPHAWVKKAEPVFSRTADVFGPGHASFTTSPDETEHWIVYHAAKYAGAGWNRNVRIQKFTWNDDGSPNFGTPVSTGVPLAIPSEKGQRPP